jgi:hypothetical protein
MDVPVLKNSPSVHIGMDRSGKSVSCDKAPLGSVPQFVTIFQSGHRVLTLLVQHFRDLLVVTLKGAVAEPSSAADFHISRPFDVVDRGSRETAL